MTRNAGPLLAIAFYDGEYSGDLTALVHLCDLDGSVVPEGRPPFSLLEEALQLLEMSADEYSAPRLLSDYFTVFVGRKIGADSATCALGCHCAEWECACQHNVRGLPEDRHRKRLLHRGR
jgi:hypothetical protein